MYLCTRILKMSAENGDPLAQSVEHHTFNVGVLGSSPKRVTTQLERELFNGSLFSFIRGLPIQVINKSTPFMCEFKDFL